MVIDIVRTDHFIQFPIILVLAVALILLPHVLAQQLVGLLGQGLAGQLNDDGALAPQVQVPFALLLDQGQHLVGNVAVLFLFLLGLLAVSLLSLGAVFV